MRWRSGPSCGDRAAAGVERPDRAARHIYRPAALYRAQCRRSREGAVLGSARRHRRHALSAARRRPRPHRPTRACGAAQRLDALAARPASPSSSVRSGCARRRARPQSRGRAPRNAGRADPLCRPRCSPIGCGARSAVDSWRAGLALAHRPRRRRPADTDFTVQGKPAEGVLLARGRARRRQLRLRPAP